MIPRIEKRIKEVRAMADMYEMEVDQVLEFYHLEATERLSENTLKVANNLLVMAATKSFPTFLEYAAKAGKTHCRKCKSPFTIKVEPETDEEE